jgi:predicted helicase
MPFTQYLQQIESALRAGDSTEHTHRPALKSLLEALADRVTATNEPKRDEEVGAPDYIVKRGSVPLGYVEAKDVGKPLGKAERTPQLKRYREGLGNLVLTDYLEFRWYVGGEHRLTARLGTPGDDGRIRRDRGGEKGVRELLDGFLTVSAPTVARPKELAERMAGLARLIRDAIREAFRVEAEQGRLHNQYDAFRRVLLHDLTPDQFADMYAQTIAYGLFAARVNTPDDHAFTRQHAAYELPRTNPFLRRMFGEIAGPELDRRIEWAVDDLAEVLRRADMAAVLRDFGKRTRQEDPVVHFYETFLAAYDPRMREARGVYYTPEPVVSYIVRSVDHLLKTEFGLPDGLADTSRVRIPNPDPGTQGKKTKDLEVHRVQILDPATGTGTFLHGVIDQIHGHLSERGQAGSWSAYVREHLLPRIWGFELLMAPYAVAHMKIGLQLKQLGYDFASDERLGIYLTNALEEAHAMADLPLFAQVIADEANQASRVKAELPILVIIGNPPYSGISANMAPRMASIVEPYKWVDGKPLRERKHWLQNDYVKFIRFAQTRIERTGHGILGFITDNSYLDGPTFRGMRRSLMETFDEVYILDLHGNSKKKEKAPGGGPDENVFDITQGVAIILAVKRVLTDTKPVKSRNHAEREMSG